ncbi:MAG: ABC transporter permease [Phycisphaeraceae bacterium]
MKSACYLAWKYTAAHKGRTLILIAALGLLLLLPTAVTLVIRSYDARMGARAQATPMIIGAKGNRYDLLLQALFFRDGRTDDVPFGLIEELEADLAFDATAIPLHARYTAQDAPLVGTDLRAYFSFRGLLIEQGDLPDMMGQAVLGHSAARRLGLSVGDTLTTDRVNLYNIANAMPLQLNIVGVLESTNSADSEAVFVDMKTAWIIAGHGHGHDPAAHASEASHSATVTAIQITSENADTFHFHGDEKDLPLSAVLVLPETDKDRTLITSRYNASANYQALRPAKVMNELMGLVLRIKRLFDANTALVCIAVVLLIGLVVALSMKLREAERKTLHKLGCGKWLIVQTQVVELAIVLAGALVIVAAGSAAVMMVSPWVLGV